MNNNINTIQQMLAGLQNQISTVSTVANQMGSFSPDNLIPMLLGANPAPTQDIPALVKTLVAEELARQQAGGSTSDSTKAEPQSLFPASPMLNMAPVTPSLFPTMSNIPQPQPQAPILMPAPAPEVPTPVPLIANTPAPQPTPQPTNSQDTTMMQEFMNRLKLSIGGCLTGEQQVWVTGNLFGFPEFFATPQGKAAVISLLSVYKQYVEQGKPK